jgi:putative PLP-dependent aminotransferase (TIGR04422 family)
LSEIAFADYQWPVAVVPSDDTYRTESVQLASPDDYRSIEQFFEYRFNVPAILMPSGRSALASILDYLHINRSHLAFASKWSSACVWETLGRVTNPTAALTPDVNIVVAIHKWGFSHQITGQGDSYIIEDSVDSLFTKASALFSLGGDFEILSLPKLVGTYSGGIVFTRDVAFEHFVQAKRALNPSLALHQAQMKFRRAAGRLQPYESVDAFEPKNLAIDVPTVLHIREQLKNWDLNRDTILGRIGRINTRFGRLLVDPACGRLPPVFPVPLRLFKFEGDEPPMIRHFDTARRIDSPTFEACWMIPLHFGVADLRFEQLLGGLIEIGGD